VKFRRVSDSEGNQGLAIRDLGSGRIEPFAVQRDITGTGALQFPVRRQRRRAVILARRRCWFAPVDVSWSQHRRELASCRETDRRGPLATRPTPPISVQLDGRAFQGSRREGPADTPRRGLCLPKTVCVRKTLPAKEGAEKQHARQSDPGCLRRLASNSGLCRLQGARDRHAEYSDIFTTPQCGRDRRRPPAILLRSKRQLRDGRRVRHPEGRTHYLCPVERRLVVRDVCKPKDRQQRLGLGKVITPEANWNHGTLIEPIRPRRPALARILPLLSRPSWLNPESNQRSRQHMR
jgi:hypothetical protein